MLRIKIYFLLLVIASPVFAETITPFQMLRYNYSARAAGLAGCFVSMTDDAGALFFNPATISTVSNKNFSATFFKHVLDVNSGQVSYIRKFEKLGTLAGSVSFTNFGSFDYSDAYGNKSGGTFGANDMSLGVTYSNELDTNLYYGVTGKFVFVNIEKATSLSFALDAGLIYSLKDKRTNVGLSILHTGMQLSKFGDLTENLPFDIRMGINHKLKGLPLLVNLSFHHLADRTDNFFDKFANFAIAGELSLKDVVQIRLGYDNQVRKTTAPDNDKKMSGLSFGVGLRLKELNFDYGLAQVGASMNLHRFGVSLNL